MAMRALLVVAGLTAAAHADDFASAQRIRVDDLAWAVTATCDAGDDVEQRQCRHVRDQRQKQLAGATLLVEAQPSAFEVGAWSPAKKSVPITLTACIDCAGLKLDTRTLYVTGAGPYAENGKLKAPRLLDTARPFADEATAKKFLALATGARVEMLVKIPDKVRWQQAGKDGIGLDIVGYRVIARCEGVILVARPEGSTAVPDKTACAAKK